MTDTYMAPWEKQGKVKHPWTGNMSQEWMDLLDDIVAWAKAHGYDIQIGWFPEAGYTKATEKFKAPSVDDMSKYCCDSLLVSWGADKRDLYGEHYGTSADELAEWFQLLGRIPCHPDGDLEFHYPLSTQKTVFSMWHD